MSTENYGILDNEFVLLKVLGSGGSSKVYLSYMQPNPKMRSQKTPNKKVAVKVFYKEKSNAIDTLKNEYTTMLKVESDNIIKPIKIGKGNLVTKEETIKDVPYLVMEYAENGDFFDYIISQISNNGFSEAFSRAIFKQIVETLYSLHKNGFCHRDIKPENFMLDKEYNIKLGDFGFAAPIEGRNGDGFLKRKCGTEGYRAPELFNEEESKYKGGKVDVFALGVTLFTLSTGRYPFKSVSADDLKFRLIIQKKYDAYWRCVYHSYKRTFSKEFQELFQKMVSYNPDERPDLEEILKDPWFNLQTATKEELRMELMLRNPKEEQTEDVNGDAILTVQKEN